METQCGLSGFLNSILNSSSSNIALRDAKSSWTYEMLRKQVLKMASQLTAASVNAGDTVVVMLPRSTDLVFSLLSILEIGAVYVPLPQSSLKRTASVISSFKFVLTRKALLAEVHYKTSNNAARRCTKPH